MAAGNVKWFNNAKGYGFILPEGGGEDLFAHYSSIQMDGYKTLKAGQQVEFDILEGPKGLHAVNIRTPCTVSTDSGIVDPEPAEMTADPEPSDSETSSPDETSSSEETSVSETAFTGEETSPSETASVSETAPASETDSESETTSVPSTEATS